MTFSIFRHCSSLLLISGITGIVNADVVIHPQNFGASVDLGQVVQSNKNLPDNQPITRSGAYLASSATVDDKLDINLGIGGLFWYALPEKNFRDRLLLGGFGMGQAEAVYSFGDGENPGAKLHMGLFNYKYNPDAKNLGEYLFRSGAYPGYIWTSGWSFINSAGYLAQGFLLSMPTFDGKVTHDFGLFMERNISPTHDLSPTYLITVKPTTGIELGAGVVWQNGISLRGDSVLAPHTRVNAYYKSGPYANLPLTSNEANKPGYEIGDTAIVPTGDTRIGQVIPGRYHLEKPAMYTDLANNGTPNSQLGYYTFKAIKLSARASVDIGSYMDMEKDMFKAYFEWAWMGVENQPFYYDKPSERMPISFGLNIPTFGLLDVFNVEMEYRKSALPNGIAAAWNQRIPLPIYTQSENPLPYREAGRPLYTAELVSQGQTQAYADSVFTSELNQREQIAKDGALHWSVYAKRRIIEGVFITGQVASDEMRHFDIVFGTPSDKPATYRTKDWYYVLRLEFGI